MNKICRVCSCVAEKKIRIIIRPPRPPIQCWPANAQSKAGWSSPTLNGGAGVAEKVHAFLQTRASPFCKTVAKKWENRDWTRPRGAPRKTSMATHAKWGKSGNALFFIPVHCKARRDSTTRLKRTNALDLKTAHDHSLGGSPGADRKHPAGVFSVRPPGDRKQKTPYFLK